MDTEVLIFSDKKELQRYLQKFNKAEFQLIYDKLLKENYSKKFVEELDYNFFADDERTIIDNKYVSTEYKTVSERFFDEYYCGIATFIEIKPNLYVSFNIPGIKNKIYEIEFTINYDNPLEDAYIEFNLKEKAEMNFDLLNNRITIE